MRDLTEQEIESYLDDNGEAEEGCTAVETTIGELARLGAGTCCGRVGNHAFAPHLAKRECRIEELSAGMIRMPKK